MKKILVVMAVETERLERLRQMQGVEVHVIPEYETSYKLPKELIEDKHILFCHLPPSNLDEMKALEWIQLGSSGYSHVTKLGLQEKGVKVTNAQGIFDTAIAEWNVSMMINLARDMRSMMHNQDKGIWDRDARYQQEIRGKTAGIWGYGGIGRETARLIKTMGIKVHAMVRKEIKPRRGQFVLPGVGDPEGVLPDRVFTSGQELEFLHDLDFLILSLPLTGNTKGLIGERELRALPANAYLLNPARGPIVQEEALLRALREGWITGAALDTHFVYPMPPDHPLWRLPNVIMTPHISGSSSNPFFLERVWELFLQNTRKYTSGEVLLNELSDEQLNE